MRANRVVDVRPIIRTFLWRADDTGRRHAARLLGNRVSHQTGFLLESLAPLTECATRPAARPNACAPRQPQRIIKTMSRVGRRGLAVLTVAAACGGTIDDQTTRSGSGAVGGSAGSVGNGGTLAGIDASIETGGAAGVSCSRTNDRASIAIQIDAQARIDCLNVPDASTIVHAGATDPIRA